MKILKYSLFILLIIAGLAGLFVVLGLGQHAVAPTSEALPPLQKPVIATTSSVSTLHTYNDPKYGYAVSYPIGAHLTKSSSTASDFLNMLDAKALEVVTLEHNYPPLLEIAVFANPSDQSVEALRQARRQHRYELDKANGCDPQQPFGCMTADEVHRETGKLTTFAGEVAYKDNIFQFDHEDECIDLVRNNYEYLLCYQSEDPNIPNFAGYAVTRDRVLASFRFTGE